MQVKTFTGKSLKQVMTQVKRELGDEAVILGTQGPGDGKIGYEVMAAIENFEASASNDSERKRGPGNDFDNMREEWSLLRESLLAVIQPQVDLGRLGPRQKVAVRYLEKEGVAVDFILNLWSRLKDDPNMSVLKALRAMVDFKPWRVERWPDRVHVFVGPHGVGKTSTVLKLALALRRRHPDLKLAVLNSDGSHGRTRSYLRHYSELSGLACRETGPEDGIDTALAELEDCDLVLVDTPGLGSGQSMVRRSSSPGWSALGRAKVHLVLNPLFSPRQYEAFLERYSCPSLSSCVWTKLDEACSFGDMLNVGWKSGLPFSIFSVGSGLKDTLFPALDQDFWQLLLKHIMPPANGGHQ
ncbi:MAG: flagellar biosynthesis protein FlhF [Deltaproteobacteria bacterium]|nr:flagellar biosynthesis protein FlhF [Deltaproteobacteria bacterium]